MPKVSIIVPAYNVEPYIAQCLDGLVGQTMQDIEIICVDDVSTDGTRAIIESYAQRDSRVKLIANDENMQLFATRHIGVSHSTGDYIVFVDGDDELVPQALEKLCAVLDDDPVDILQFGVKVVGEPWVDPEAVRVNQQLLEDGAYRLEGDEVLSFRCFERPQTHHMHHRVFRGDLARQVLVDLGFERGLHVAEDVTELTALEIAASSYRLIPDAPFYIYHLGRGQNESKDSARLGYDKFDYAVATKGRCRDNLMRYLDEKGLHTPFVDECVDAVWKRSCLLSVSSWHHELDLADRERGLRSLDAAWPAEWVREHLSGCLLEDSIYLHQRWVFLRRDWSFRKKRWAANSKAALSVYPDFVLP